MGWSRRVTAGAIVATLVSASAVVPALSASAASPPVNDARRHRQHRAREVHPEHRRRRRQVDGSGRQPDGGRRLVHPGDPDRGRRGRHHRHAQLTSSPSTPPPVRSRRRFAPAVNGEVDAIVPTADGTGVYVGGAFTTAGGVSTRLAEFNLSTGALVTTFNPSLNGQINALALAGSRLFVAGTFTVGQERDPRRAGLAQPDHRRARPVPVDQPDRQPQLRPGRRRRLRPRRRHRHGGLARRHADDRRRQLHQRRRPGQPDRLRA